MKNKLTPLVGQYIEVRAGDDCADSNGIHFSFYGQLEAPEDDDNRFYLRVGESSSGHGTMGIGFHPNQVESVDKRPSGLMQINLRKHLIADAD
jgi:hypothetical protein